MEGLSGTDYPPAMKVPLQMQPYILHIVNCSCVCVI